VSPICICFSISDKGGLYTSRTPYSSMKSGAKLIVESMESARDRVAVMTFPCAMSNNVYTLNASGSVARQQLLEDIMSLSSVDEHPAIVSQCQGSSNGRD